MQRREELLSKHPYKIYQANDGKWCTYIADVEKGRKLIRRNSRESIEQYVIDFIGEKELNPAIREIYDEWILGKLNREEISKQTKDRYNRQFIQCFKNFGNRKIKNVSEYDIEDFILSAIHECELTRKGFSNLRTIVFGIFKLAKKKKYIPFSITEVVSDIEISKKSFRKEIKQDDELIFMIDEVPKVTEYLKENADIINLGILLMFKTGLRIGELCTLEKTDIENNVIHVHKTEICYEDAKGNRIFEVRDFPKTEAGIRDVIIPDNVMWILKKLRSMNPFGKFIFEKNGTWIRSYSFRSRLLTICKRLNITKKSPNKIRKTYGTILLDSGAPESVVISQMGHTNIKTTKDFYYKNRRNAIQKSDEINKIVGL